jgi:hypothetical protein
MVFLPEVPLPGPFSLFTPPPQTVPAPRLQLLDLESPIQPEIGSGYDITNTQLIRPNVPTGNLTHNSRTQYTIKGIKMSASECPPPPKKKPWSSSYSWLYGVCSTTQWNNHRIKHIQCSMLDSFKPRSLRSSRDRTDKSLVSNINQFYSYVALSSI